MRLTLREAAASLNCTEKTVLRWIAHAGLPTVRLGGLYHFNRAELMEWAIHHGIGSTALACELEPEPDAGPDASKATVSALAGALRAGGILTGVPGATLAEVLCAAVASILPVAREAERELTWLCCWARGHRRTAIGGGVWCRTCARRSSWAISRASARLSATPLPQSAVPTPDGKPIEAVFVLASPTVRAHLTLLALLAAALRDADFGQAVLSRAPEAAILNAAAAAEHLHQSAAKRQGRRQ